jgi:hypothetical protein
MMRELVTIALQTSDIPTDLLNDIVAYAYAAKSHSVWGVIEQLQESAIAAILNVCTKQANQEIPCELLSILERHPEFVTGWYLAASENARNNSALLLAKCVDPRVFGRHPSAAPLWRKGEQLDFLSDHDRSMVHAFTLAIAFESNQPEASNLISVSFDHVYERAEQNRLDIRSWRVLEQSLPQLSWHRNWDKCERLRRAIGNALTYKGWPLSIIPVCFVNEYRLRSFLKSCNKSDSGQSINDQIRAMAKRGESPAWASETIQSYFD